MPTISVLRDVCGERRPGRPFRMSRSCDRHEVGQVESESDDTSLRTLRSGNWRHSRFRPDPTLKAPRGRKGRAPLNYASRRTSQLPVRSAPWASASRIGRSSHPVMIGSAQAGVDDIRQVNFQIRPNSPGSTTPQSTTSITQMIDQSGRTQLTGHSSNEPTSRPFTNSVYICSAGKSFRRTLKVTRSV